MNKNPPFLGVFTFLSFLASSPAEAHLICAINHTDAVQEITFTPADGLAQTARAEASETACVDVGPAWQPFQYALRDATAEPCQNKQIWPSTWLTLEGKQGAEKCSVHADNLPGLKDYSVRMFVQNADDWQDAEIFTGASNCGYFEWLPLVVKKKTNAGFPMRIISTGGCWDERTFVHANFKEPYNGASWRSFECSGGNLSCGSGASSYFGVQCRPGESGFSIYLRRL